MVDIRPQDLNPAVTPIDADSPIIIDQGLAGVNRTTSNEMVNAVAPVATQAEAEVGTDDVKRMTALKTKQSIASEVGVTVASYAAGQAGLSAVQSVNGKSGNSVTLVKGDVGLGNVDNTSDVDKPVSTAQQTALNLKADKTIQIIATGGMTGGGDLTGNVTVELDAMSVASLAKADSAVQSVSGKSGNSITLVKGDVGLGNVDNTSDVAKPVSTAQQAALNLKANTATQIIAGAGLTGGGDLSANRTVNVVAGTGISVAADAVSLDASSIASLGKADTALQAPGGGAGQVLAKNSAADNDVAWISSEAATAVSYGPQTLTEVQQGQARENINVHASPVKSLDGFNNSNPIFIAHRNQALLYADQTLGAFRKSSLSPYVDALEMDCRVISDGTPVCFHDATVDRVTTSSGSVEALNVSQFKNLFVDASVWHGGVVYDDDEVVTVREAVREFNGKKLFMPEIKTAGSAQDVIDVFIEEGVRKDHAVFSSFVMSDLPPVIAAGYPAMFTTNGGTQQHVDDAVAMGVTWVGLSRSASDSIVSMWVDSGLKVVMWTVNRRYDRDRLLSLGVTGFYSDDVEYLARDKPASSSSKFNTGKWNYGMIASDDSLSDVSRGRISPNGWGFNKTDASTTTVRRSVLQGWASPLPADSWTLTAEVTVGEMEPGANGWIGFVISDTDRPVLDASTDDNYTNGVNFLVSPTGNLGIYAISSGVATQIASVPAPDGLPCSDGSSLIVKVSISGNNVTLSRLNQDGTILYTATVTTPLASGRFLHILKRFHSFYVDNIKVNYGTYFVNEFSKDIVTAGVKNGVNFKRYSDGTQECWGRLSNVPLSGNTTFTVEFPIAFSSLPTLTGSPRTATPSSYHPLCFAGDNSSASIYVHRTTSGGTAYLDWHAKGVWK